MINVTTLLNSFLLLLKRYGLSLLKIFVAVGLLVYIVNRIKFEKIINGIKLIDYSIFTIVVLLLFVNVYLQFIRWKTLISAEDKSIENNSVWESLLIGFTAGTFTLARVGEYFLRKLPLKNLSLTTVITLTFIDKMMLLINVIFWGSLVSFGMMIFYYQVDWYIVLSLFILFVAFFAGLFSFLYSKSFYNFLKEVTEKLPIKIGILKKLLKPLSDLDNILMSKLFVLALLNFLVMIVQLSLLVYAFDNQLKFENLLVASIMVFFSKTIIPAISIGEIGVREGAAIYFFGIFGCEEAFAFDAALLLFVINLLLPSLIGLFLLFKLKKSDKNWQV